MSLNEQLEAVRQDMQVWKDLQSSKGWELMKIGVEAQLRGRRVALDDLRPSGIDALISIGGSISEMAGMRLVLGWPEIMLNELRLKEQQLLEMINEH